MDNTAPSETSAPDRRRFLRTLGVGGVASALAVAISASKADARQSTPPGTNAAATGGNAGQAGGSGAGEGSGSNGSNGGQSGATPNSISQDASGSAPASSGGTTAGSGATTATTGPAASTTTTIAAPKFPTAADIKVLSFAMQYELAISGAYDAAIGRLDASTLTLDPTLVPVVRVFRQHHIAYAQALSGVIGKTAPSSPNATILKSIVGPFTTGTADDFLKAAAVVENTAVATHLTLLAELASTDAATLIASVIPIEARHAIVFELAAKSTDLIPASGSEDLSLALDPSKYPAE